MSNDSADYVSVETVDTATDKECDETETLLMKWFTDRVVMSEVMKNQETTSTAMVVSTYFFLSLYFNIINSLCQAVLGSIPGANICVRRIIDYCVLFAGSLKP
jgi:hypothetical protein